MSKCDFEVLGALNMLDGMGDRIWVFDLDGIFFLFCQGDSCRVLCIGMISVSCIVAACYYYTCMLSWSRRRIEALDNHQLANE